MTFDFRTGSSYEPFLNYFLGVFAVICALISTFLNPLIFYVYTKKQKNILNMLFKVIAISDFLTNLLPAIFISYVFLSSVKFNQYTFLNQLPEFLCCTFGCISQVTVTLMAITRMIKIIRPFFSVEVKCVLAYLIFYTVYMALANAASLIIAWVEERSEEDPEDSSSLDTLKSVNMYACFSMNMLHCFVGLVCSFITVGYLWVNMMGNDLEALRLKLRSSNTILLMNIPYVISIVTHFLALDKDIGMDLSLVKHYMIPIMTSAFNPCVIVARTNTIKSFMIGWRGSNELASSFRSRTQLSQIKKSVPAESNL